MFGIGFGIGVIAGLAAGVGVFWLGMRFGEKMAWSAKEGTGPVLSAYDKPLMQSNTSGDEDEESESDDG